MLKKNRSKYAVSEVVGVILLLVMTMMLFAVLNFNVFSFTSVSSIPSVNLIGTIDKDNNLIILEHSGGDSLEGTTKILVIIGSDTYPSNTSDLLIDINNDKKWNLGEILEFSYKKIDIIGKQIRVMVLDSNAVLLSVVLKQGSS
jgi:FlaG/FlaF family flagellin (archaellin)